MLSCPPRTLSIIEFLKEPGVPLWHCKEFQEVRLLDQLVHRFSLHQSLVGHLDRVGDSDLRHVTICSVMQHPPVDELIVCPPVQRSFGFTAGDSARTS